MQNLKVAGIQFNINWKNKEKNFEYLNKELEKLKEVDLVVLPEMFQTGFCFDLSLAEDFANSETILWLKEWAKRLNTNIIASLMIKEDLAIYNRLVVAFENGEIETYDKRHLFSMSDEPKHFSAGKKKLIVDINGWRICPMVCYDLRFPVWIRNTENYDVLVFVANWPQKRSTHWEKLLEARSIENQCFTIGVNRVGDDGNATYHDGKSAIINPLGEKIEQIIDSEGILYAELQKVDLDEIRLKMPFLKDADNFEILG